MSFAFARRVSYQRAVKSLWPLSRCCFLTDRMRVCVCVVLHARSVWTRNSSQAFTDVRTRPVGISIARSCTKSEYAEPLVLAY